MKTKNPDANDLDDEEKEILAAYRSGSLELGKPSANLALVAKETLKKSRNINIRLTENDLVSIKMLAAREGLPYQTLIGSLIHKYAAGSLKDVA
jgi:predicted DNA binding CopG/RHH family protein